MDEQRSLLDSLMGIDRDACAKDRNKRDGESFKDSKNTKRELGPCPYLHNDHVLSEFEAHKDVEELTKKYERNLKIFLEDIVREADRWIDREKRNMRKPIPDIADLLTDDEKEQIEKLNAAAADLIARSAVDAEEGNFAASEQKTAQAMQAKASAEGLRERRLQAYMKREEMGAICDICGIRTELELAELQAADKPGVAKRPRHEEGKVHQGYIKVRDKIREIDEKDRLRAAREPDRGVRRVSHSRRDKKGNPDSDKKENPEEDNLVKKDDEEQTKDLNPDGLPSMDDSLKTDERKGESETKDRSKRRSPMKDRSKLCSPTKDRSRRGSSRDRRRSRSREKRSRRDRSRRRRSYGRRR